MRPEVTNAPPLYPLTGTCDYCGRERDDLFFHEWDEAFYCVNVFQCEARKHILDEREERA